MPGSMGEPRSGGSAAAVAEELRAMLVRGEVLPGQRLPEELFRARFTVSRSTVREAFRLLTQDNLVVHILDRGVFVRELSLGDIADIYRLRRVVEVGAVHQLEGCAVDTRALAKALETAEAADQRQSWEEVAAAGIEFHLALVDLAGSPRLSRINRSSMLEFRLAYALMSDVTEFHHRYIARNRTIFRLVSSGRIAEAARELEQYLTDSEEQLRRAVGGRL